MKICIYGAGAIGAYLGAQLAKTDCEVSLVARGPHLKAMQSRGLTLRMDGKESQIDVVATDDPATLGPQDYVIITLKAHSVSGITDQIATLLDDNTAIVTAQNGVLWWYFYGMQGPLANHQLDIADPGGKIWNTLGPERAIGCVVYPSCEIAAPGVVEHINGNRFILGEPDGSKSDRVSALAQLMTEAGLKAPVRRDIRSDIWFKLLGNATFNPVSVLTGATLEAIGTDPGVRAVIHQMMSEAQAVGSELGVKFPMSIEKRIAGGAGVGAHKTSMLQDLEAGRPLELDALVTSVSELGKLVDVPTPTLDMIIDLVKLKVSQS